MFCEKMFQHKSLKDIAIQRKTLKEINPSMDFFMTTPANMTLLDLCQHAKYVKV